ncbi:MAG: TadE/TadG family type IV pilus assembly protein [Acidimicrobiia bacterium]
MRRLARLEDERGANLVEFALVLPVLVALVFGIVEFGIAYNSNLELRSGSREGARLAAVDNGCSVTPASCSGFDATGRRNALVADTRARMAGLADPSEIGVDISFPDGAAQAGDDVRVCVYHAIDSATGMFPFLNGTVLESVAVMRLEQDATFVAGHNAPASWTGAAHSC